MAGCLGVVSCRSEAFLFLDILLVAWNSEGSYCYRGIWASLLSFPFSFLFSLFYDSFSDIIVLGCDFKQFDDFNCNTLVFWDPFIRYNYSHFIIFCVINFPTYPPT